MSRATFLRWCRRLMAVLITVDICFMAVRGFTAPFAVSAGLCAFTMALQTSVIRRLDRARLAASRLPGAAPDN